MRTRLLFRIFVPVLAFAAMAAALPAAAPRFKILHAFGSGKDGAGVWGSLARDSAGHLYGTTSGGGAYGYGTVFELTPHTDGTWTEKLLHSFRNNDPHGDDLNAGLVLDSRGDLYGTATSGGGSGTNGTVFQMKRISGRWHLVVLHRFRSGDHACCPSASLILDGAGNLYGTAGSAFELSPDRNSWTELILHEFPSFSGDGVDPYAGLIMDAVGNLYGTTEMGGTNNACGGGCGTAYELSPTSDGKWKETIVHNFRSFPGDGDFPSLGALAIDESGSLFGTTTGGGETGWGTVYKLTHRSGGKWKETILHNFAPGNGGEQPGAGVIRDKAGNLYGTTVGGGSGCDCGVVYKLAPGKNGKWTYTVLHTFVGSDGAQPDANLILDDKGNLYGTTATGGPGGYGVAFELTP
jgi:uncharacterized repeat protein (TIGR03803 family)